MPRSLITLAVLFTLFADFGVSAQFEPALATAASITVSHDSFTVVPAAEVQPPAPSAAPTAAAIAPAKVVDPSRRTPAHLSIPSAKIDSPVIRVGVNAKGEMDVPDGSTNQVGWYKGGPTPGDMGSAVLDAHVYAAFKTLHEVRVGDEVFVTTEGGEVQRFVVEETVVYKLSDLTPDMLFNRNDARRLNLITCAGVYVKSAGTYTHRLVVYAVYAGTV